MQRTDSASLSFYTASFTSSTQGICQKKEVQSLLYRREKKEEEKALRDEGLDLIKD